MNLQIMKYLMLQYTGSLLLLLFSCCLSFGQDSERKYIPSAYRLGVDLTGVGYTIFGTSHNHYEINNDFQFGKYFFALDLGTISRTFNWDDSKEDGWQDYIYQFNGRFFRAGIDYNFIPKDPDNNVIFVGLRYGRAYFHDNMQFAIDDDIFGFQYYNNVNEKLRGRWFEANAGMKIKVWNHIFLGYTLRMKFARKVKGETNLSAYEIPGYGKAANNSIFGFNYHVFYRIPFQ